MVERHPSVTSAVLGGLLLLGASGCTAEQTTAVPLDRATGAVLADAADRLADALESDRPCWALLEADALRDRASRALGQGDAPESVVEETIRVVDATTADLSCDEPDGPEDGEDGEDDPDAADETDDGDDADDEDADGGAEPEPTGTTTEPDPEPAPAPAPPSGGSGDGGDGSGGGGEGRGPEGDGPPGQNRGSGSGGGPPAGRGGG